jgi:hypothetical protein
VLSCVTLDQDTEEEASEKSHGRMNIQSMFDTVIFATQPALANCGTDPRSDKLQHALTFNLGTQEARASECPSILTTTRQRIERVAEKTTSACFSSQSLILLLSLYSLAMF